MKRLTPGAIQLLTEQPWRGNVRELKHFVETAAIFSDEPLIDHLHLMGLLRKFAESPPGQDAHTEPSLRDATISYERARINDALAQTDGNITKAAALLNIDRATLSKKIKRLGIRPG